LPLYPVPPPQGAAVLRSTSLPVSWAQFCGTEETGTRRFGVPVANADNSHFDIRHPMAEHVRAESSEGSEDSMWTHREVVCGFDKFRLLCFRALRHSGDPLKSAVCRPHFLGGIVEPASIKIAKKLHGLLPQSPNSPIPQFAHSNGPIVRPLQLVKLRVPPNRTESKRLERLFSPAHD
jgi:hypothetical protein